jgi:8-oxo-dGTP pyrophosphatase MutT (NUDIX family)
VKGDDRVWRAATADLSVGGSQWRWAEENAAAIERHWSEASARNPNFFNGIIHLIAEMERDTAESRVRARFIRTDFKSYLLWRHLGFPETGVRDGFGSGLIRATDGTVILGRQRPGNVNSGLAYLPGGFIDDRDVDGRGRIDIAASVAREVREETGLDPAHFAITPGFIVTEHKAHVSFSVEYRSGHSAAQLIEAVGRHIARQRDPELSEAVAVHDAADIARLGVPGYARVLLAWLFAEEQGRRADTTSKTWR